MLRPALTLLLLLHYLLVACAGVAGRPEVAQARPFAYVHSPDCQLRNAWRGGTCFEDCNGAQYHRGHKPPTLPQVLAALKGVDVHCQPAPVAAVAAAATARYHAERRPPGRASRVPAGVRGLLFQPPRRG